MDSTKSLFEPTVSLKRPDNIQSSDYTYTKPFIASHDMGCEKPNFFYLLSMEYQRLWMKEKSFYVKHETPGPTEVLRRGTAVKHEDKIPRLTVPDHPQKRTTQYDHVKSKYLDISNYRRKPYFGYPRLPPSVNHGEVCTNTCYLNRKRR